ncbi:DegQ family serine endoprotease [Hyphococcus luteus]|nr:DegQ family serine endoprotease [Marinicaulis flavus]
MRLRSSLIFAALLAASAACAQPAPETQDAQGGGPGGGGQGEMAGDIIESPRVVPQSMEEVKLSFAPGVERAAPAVVNVYTKRVIQQRSPFAGDPFFERFFGGAFDAPRERVQNSLGSGVLVSPDGVIVTNNHVIEGMTEIKVVLHDRREYEAELVMADPQTDLAVLQIEADEPLPFLSFANSDSIHVGDVVLAIGNPFGVGQTVTSGIVSALARTAVSISDYQFFIQTDAAINPGNSGGALIDIDGRLVGVNSAIYSRSGGSNGIGFAIPSRLVQQVIKSAVSGTALVRPWIGASSDTVTADMAKALKLDRPAGAIVNDVWKKGPADRAGIKPGDVITEVDGQPVYDAQALQYRVGVNNDGDTTRVVYVRNGKQHTASVKLALPPENPARDTRELEGKHPLNGVTVDNLSPRYSEELGLDPLSKGVVVSKVDGRSFAARRGLRPGHKIISINGKEISTTAELEREIKKPATRWELEVDTGGRIVPWRVGR